MSPATRPRRIFSSVAGGTRNALSATPTTRDAAKPTTARRRIFPPTAGGRNEIKSCPESRCGRQGRGGDRVELPDQYLWLRAPASGSLLAVPSQRTLLIMPAFPIVDTHLHIWDPGRLRYPWLAAVPALNRRHLIEDYRRACGPVAVAKMVFLQCECEFSQFEAESDWVTEVAREDPRIRGIVPWAPLEKGTAAESSLARLAANPLVKGT